MTTCHIIVAAGSGSRFGAEIPKQFCRLSDSCVLMTTIDAFRSAMEDDDRLILVLSEGSLDLWADLCKEYGFVSPEIVIGGSSRWESVRNALQHVGNDVEVITVHDGARPLVTGDIIRRTVEAVKEGADGAIPVVPVTDSLRRIENAGSVAVDRSVYRAVQTPQAFPAELLLRAYSLPFKPEFTDDASVMEASGYTNFRLVDGSVDNIKITHPRDLMIAEMILQSRK